MDGSDKFALAREVAGAIAWWREAGVDLCFDDEPAKWISPAQPTALAAERLRAELREAAPTDAEALSSRSAVREPAGTPATRGEDAIDMTAMPDDLVQFASWWLSEPSLDGGRRGGRVPPRGVAGAALMVLVAEPEEEDAERLLAGPQGRLLAGIVSALGVGEDAVYVASALPRHTPMPDWAELAARGMGDALARHVILAAPQRLVAFGSGVLSLLGNSLPNNAAATRAFSHDGFSIPVFAARSLEAIVARPAWKAELWQGLLDWMPPVPG